MYLFLLTMLTEKTEDILEKPEKRLRRASHGCHAPAMN